MSVIYYVVNEVEPSHVHFVDNSITFKTKNVKKQGPSVAVLAFAFPLIYLLLMIVSCILMIHCLIIV